MIQKCLRASLCSGFCLTPLTGALAAPEGEGRSQRWGLVHILLKALMLEIFAPPVAFRHLRLAGPFASEHAHHQRDAVDAGQVKFLAEGQHLRSVQQDIQPVLDRGAVGPLDEKTNALRVIGAPAVPTDLAHFGKLFQRLAHLPGALERVVPDVEQVQVDGFGVQTAQAGFTGPPDVRRGALFLGRLAGLFVKGVPELGGDYHLVTRPANACPRTRSL
jgi:hypothetical protein